MHKGFDSVWQRLGFGKDQNPDEIIRTVKNNVLSLIEDCVLKEEPTTLIRVGRKGFHLTSQYDAVVGERGFTTCVYRIIKTSRFSQTKPPIQIPTEKPVILIADSVHTGDEMSIVLSDLQLRDVKVKKVFCYLRNESGVESLVLADLIDSEKIVGLFSSHSEKEYMKEYNLLQVFFRSRIQPMDTDLCFNLYTVNKALQSKDLENTLKPILEHMFGKKILIEEFSDRSLASNIKEIHCRIEESPKTEEIAEGLFQEDFDCKLKCVVFRFKMEQKKMDTEFTIIVRTEADCILQKTDDVSKCLNISENCCMTRIRYKTKKRSDVMKMICPSCVDSLISHSILNELNSIVIDGFNKKGLKCRLIWAYRPYEHLV